MKWKRWYLYVVVTLCFVIAFVTINKKYDPFYRVNGINNDNRALIEMYLDENEQQYLIDNAIAMNKFIKYIESPNFYLPYYEYYNLLDSAKVFKNIDELVNNSNTIAARLTATMSSRAISSCKELISNNLVLAYLNRDTFAMNNIDYYQQVRMLYDDVDYSYIDATNTYLDLLTSWEVTDSNKRYDIIKQSCDNYDKDSLNVLFTTTLLENVERVYNPSELGIVINTNHFIASYEPKSLVIATNIPRTSYSMYLQKDAYEALNEMYETLKNECGKGFILTRSYRSYDMLSLQNDDTTLAGFNEYQLGTTVQIQKQGYSSEDFISTELYQWLIQNSYKYGYILRYPEGKQEVTGHAFSSTTYRYVGVELATKLYQEQLTLEEYQVAKD